MVVHNELTLSYLRLKSPIFSEKVVFLLTVVCVFK